MKKISKILLCSLLVLSMVGLVACGGGNDQQQQQGNENQQPEVKTYIVGTNPTFPPFESVDENDAIVGFDIDLLEAIAADQGIKFEYKSLEFDALIIELNNGTIDVIASGMSITPARLETIDFSDPYFNAGLSIMVTKDSPIKSSADLAGKVVGAQVGTTGAEECYGLEEDGIVKEAKILNTYDTCALELQNGSCDAIIIDTPVGQKFQKNTEGEIILLEEQLLADDYGFGIFKGNAELQEKLNTGLANVKANGTYDELLTKWELN